MIQQGADLVAIQVQPDGVVDLSVVSSTRSEWNETKLLLDQWAQRAGLTNLEQAFGAADRCGL